MINFIIFISLLPFILIHELFHIIFIKLYRFEIDEITFETNFDKDDPAPLWDFSITRDITKNKFKEITIALAPLIPCTILGIITYNLWNSATDTIDYLLITYLVFGGVFALLPSLHDISLALYILND